MPYDIATVLGLTGIAFIFGYLALNIDRERHALLQFLFLTSCLYFILYDFYTMARINDISLNISEAINQTIISDLMIGGYDATMIIIILFLMYIVVYTIEIFLRYFDWSRRAKIEKEE